MSAPVGAFMATSLYDLTVHFRPSNLIKFSATPSRPARKQSQSVDSAGIPTGGFPQCLVPSMFEDVSLPNSAPPPAQQGGHLGISTKLQQSSLPPNSIQCSEQNFSQLTPAALPFSFQSWNHDIRIPGVLKHLPKSMPPRPEPKKFTKHARQTLLDAGGALDKEILSWADGSSVQRILPQDCFFFTATLPGSTSKSMEMLSRYSRYIVNLLKTFLRQKYCIDLTINVWEWQKRGALHFHLLYVLPGRSAFGFDIGEELREKWLDYLGLIEKQSGVDMYARSFGGSWHRKSKSVQENSCKTVQLEARAGSSPVAYLSKYIGKGGLAAQLSGINAHDLYYPSSWWSISKAMRILINKHSASFTIRIPSSEAVSTLLELSDLFSLEGGIACNPFSPVFAPDYTYRSIYCPPEHYFELIESMRMTLQGLVGMIGLPCTDSSFSDFVYLQWLHQPENHKQMSDFTFNWLSLINTSWATEILFWESSPDSSQTFYDFLCASPAAPALEQKAKKYCLQHYAHT